MKPLLAKIGMCSLNNDPLDFKKNKQRIIQSIKRCKKDKCTIRVGSQLQVPGYSCHDHFNQYDTIIHSWQVIRDIIQSGVTEGIVCDLGCPVLHHGNIYNSRVVVFNSKVVGIRAKTILADGDNYYETRWFGFWKQKKKVDQFKLPKIIQQVTGQFTVPIGVFVLDFNDACLGFQVCQQAWISDNPMIEAVMDGVQIMVNPSASNLQCGKLERKIQMIKQLTQRHGGAYLYTNIKGCTGDRIYFDGGCMFAQNGVIKGLSNLNSLDQIMITNVVVDITKIRAFRISNKSFLKSSNGVHQLPRIKVDFNACTNKQRVQLKIEQSEQITKLIKEYQHPHARYQPSIYLWDFLRKSSSTGFFIGLSGGLDSCVVAIMVYNMCFLVFKEIENGNQCILEQLRKVIGIKQFLPKSAKQICNKLLFTCYMGTQYTSQQTRNMATLISKQINSYHKDIQFSQIFQHSRKLVNKTVGKQLKFTIQGGSYRSDNALRNIQSRTRMVLSYLFSEALTENFQRDADLIVLGCSNADQLIIGFYNKYDSTAADINPIGTFSRQRLKEYLNWSHQVHQFSFVQHILCEKSKKELVPPSQEQLNLQDDRAVGLTSQQISKFARLRRVQKLGPVSMFQAIVSSIQGKQLSPKKVAKKIKIFFNLYRKNRLKISVHTPCLHYYSEGCEDSRLDIRPLFYQTNWQYQFQLIDHAVKQLQKPQSIQQSEQIKQSTQVKKQSKE